METIYLNRCCIQAIESNANLTNITDFCCGQCERRIVIVDEIEVTPTGVKQYEDEKINSI